MPLKLLIREHPQRAIAVVTSSHALVFRYSTSNTAAATGINEPSAKTLVSKCLVEFSALEAVDLSGYRQIHTASIYGTVGLINVKSDVFLCLITGATRVATVRPGETVQRISSVDFCP